MVYYEWSKARPNLCTNLIFQVTFTKVYPIPIQNNMHWWCIEIKEIPTNFMIILGICQKQPFDIIAMALRGTLGLCCTHISQLMTHPAIYTLRLTLQLCYKHFGILKRVTKIQRVHISSHDKLQKLHNINAPGHRYQGFLREG